MIIHKVNKKTIQNGWDDMTTIEKLNLTSINEIDNKRLGMYFTNSINFAKTYGKNVISVGLSINNPFDARTGNLSGYVNAKSFVSMLPISNNLKAELSMGVKETLAYGLLEGALKENIVVTLKSHGFDGIVFNEGYAETWIPFYEYQILNPINNENIYYHGSDDSFKKIIS